MPAARIDLHAHSTASDGTTSPAELVLQARAAGLDLPLGAPSTRLGAAAAGG